jgi:hypothetical protein
LGDLIPPLKRRSEWRFRKLQKPRDRSRKPTSAPDASVIAFIDPASDCPAFTIHELNSTAAASRKSLIWNLDRRKNRASAQRYRARRHLVKGKYNDFDDSSAKPKPDL